MHSKQSSIYVGTFRRWAQGRDVSVCRLVQYVGVDLLGAIDVPLGEVESQIEGLVCEGFLVAWAQLCRVIIAPEGSGTRVPIRLQ